MPRIVPKIVALALPARSRSTRMKASDSSGTKELRRALKREHEGNMRALLRTESQCLRKNEIQALRGGGVSGEGFREIR
jgi:hypothetical protein